MRSFLVRSAGVGALGLAGVAALIWACSSSSAPAGPVDAGGDATGDGGDAGQADRFVLTCPPAPPPVATVAVDAYFGQPAFHIDATEVSQAAYCQFLMAASPASQDTICQWNPSFYPSTANGACTFDPQANPNHPVVCVDWCDAYGYCKAQGKRLCGARGGGALDPIALGDGDDAGSDRLVNFAEYDEWFAACSHNDDGQHKYSVGDLIGPTTCNSPANSNMAPVDVGSISTCVGGFPGLFDMSGNVWEWENACPADDLDAGDGGPNPPFSDSTCRIRGGAFDGNLLDLTCRLSGTNDTLLDKRVDAHPNLGFRCCAD